MVEETAGSLPVQKVVEATPAAEAPPATTPPVVDAAPASGGPPRRGRLAEKYATKDLTEGSISRNLWFLAWPQMTEGALYVFYQMVDLFWAGQGFGLNALAGVGAVATYATLSQTARGGLDTAMRAMISRAVGAGDMVKANQVLLQSFVMMTFTTVVFVVLPGVIFADQLLAMLNIPKDVRVEVHTYMQLQFVNQGLVGWRMMTGTALLASGDSLTPLRATFATRAIHIVLSPLLAFGVWIFPDLGLMGLAAARIIGQLEASVLNWNSVCTGRSRLHITLKGYKVDWALNWRLLRLGIPASITSAERSMAQLAMIGVVSSFGVTALGVYSLVQRADILANRIISGLASASGVLVGQNLGADQPQRARKTVLVAINWALVGQTIFALLLATFPVVYISIFSSNNALHGIGTHWFRIIAVGYIAAGVGTILMQALNSAGDTIIPAVVNVGTIWIIQLPVALLLRDVFGFDSTAVAWAIVAALLVRILIYVPYFLSGRWMRSRVL